MTYVKINGKTYPAVINGKMTDREWDNRESKTITLEMAYADAINLFVNNLIWSIVMDIEQEDGSTVQEEYDNSEYSIAGSITDNRNGTIAVKMGKPTEVESLQAQYANAITEEELNRAYAEGVNSL